MRREEMSDQSDDVVESVIEAAIERLMFYQRMGFRCHENSMAILKLEQALHWLNAKTLSRIKRKVDGKR